MGNSYKAGLRGRFGVVALLFVLTLGSIGAWADSASVSNTLVSAPDAGRVESFAPSARVMLFIPGVVRWIPATFEQAKPGDEFVCGGQLYRALESNRAQVVSNIGVGRLVEADLPLDNTSRRPVSGDVVQVFDKDTQFAAHAVLETVQLGATIRFQGKVYTVAPDRSLTDTGKVFSAATCTLRRIDITPQGMQHVTERHTVGGNGNAGKSIFSPGENIQTLIRYAQLVSPVLEANGYFKRDFEAGRVVGTIGQGGRRSSVYRVITTQTGKLVTAYPVVP